VVAARREQVSPKTVDALVAAWVRAPEPDRALLVALLQACGDEKDDERARGLAAHLVATGDARDLSRQGEAARGYARAARHFARAGEVEWQAASLNQLGAVLLSQGEHEEALKHFRRALQLRQALYPAEKYPRGHPDLAQSLNNVATVLHDQGEYEQALKHSRQALEMLQALYPADSYPQGHPYLALGLSSVGGVLLAQGEHEQALKHFRRALQMHQHSVEHLASSAPEERALTFAASLPLMRDAFLSASSHVRGSAADAYAAVWPTRSAVTRAHERRHLALLAAASPTARAGHARLLDLRRQRARLLLAPLPAHRAAASSWRDWIKRSRKPSRSCCRCCPPWPGPGGWPAPARGNCGRRCLPGPPSWTCSATNTSSRAPPSRARRAGAAQRATSPSC
jgi:tetratricopeptide (TPR) repeat protein